MYTHVIKNRLLKSIPTVISKMQSGFQAGKSTSDNLILMCLPLEHFQNNEEEEGLICQVDLMKAFDSVEHAFLFETLKGMGFGEYMISLIKTAFNGCMSLANVNGHLTEPIYLLRGLHQGSPLSPLLFLIVAQVLTITILDNPQIEGLDVTGQNIIMSLFADDTDLFLKASINCITALFSDLENFGVHSGCKANVSKTRCIPLGKTRSDTDLLSSLKHKFGNAFVTDEFTALGIYFTNSLSLKQITDINYERKMKTATGWVESWKRRDLSLYGKVTIVKSLIMSQFSYLVLPLPRPSAAITKRINTLIFNFLWGCKRDKIKRDQIVRPVSMGGLDMFNSEDFILSLKVSLISKTLNDSFGHSWKNIVFNQLKYRDHAEISIENGLTKKPSFYYTLDLLNSYQDWKHRTSAAREATINHCVWANTSITDVGAKLWNDSLIRRGVYYLDQFLADDMSILPYGNLLEKWDLTQEELSKNRYVDIKMAIRRFDCPSNPLKSITNISTDINISQFRKPVRGRAVRMTLIRSYDIDTLTPLWEWRLRTGRDTVDWSNILYHNRYNMTNNFKLVQFQYKLLMRISTCKLSRWRMNIEKDNGNCAHCNVAESLNHIFFECSHTSRFIVDLNQFIKDRFDSSYTDTSRYHFLTCFHDNNYINFVNLAAKWYISRRFQTKSDLLWSGFLKHLKIFMLGERADIRRELDPILSGYTV